MVVLPCMTHSSSTYFRLRCTQNMFILPFFTLSRQMLIHKAVWIHISIKQDSHRTVLYFLVYDQDKEKQKDFKNVMSFRDTVVY